MERSDGRKLSIEALNERRRRAVKMRLAGATIMGVVEQCELGRSAVIRASQAHARGGWRAVSVTGGGRPTGSGRLLS
jgi:transposase